MTSSVSRPHPTPVEVRPAWAFAAAGTVRGLALAREKGWVLAWDDKNWLYLLDRAGRRQAQVPVPGAVVAAGGADDGSSYAVTGRGGEVWWLAPDLLPRWHRNLSQPATAAAMDPFGCYLAVADSAGHLVVLDRLGRRAGQAHLPRPLHHLAFVPEAPVLIGSADLGLVAGFDLTGRVRWRDGLAAQVGALSVSGAGDRVVLACYSEGLRGYTQDGRKRDVLPTPEPCRLAAMSYDGHKILAGGLSNRLLLLDAGGRVLTDYLLDKGLAALTLGALADRAVVALADGQVLGLDLREPP